MYVISENDLCVVGLRFPFLNAHSKLFLFDYLLLDSEDSSIAQVRDHIESLVESLVGKNLDEAKVIQLFDHPSCKLNTFSPKLFRFQK